MQQWDITLLAAFAQSPSAGVISRCSIGLALEGGALGLAHIRVLEGFRENCIPIDYVESASMGAGGVYTTPIRTAEIPEPVSQIHCGKVLRVQAPYRDLACRRQEDRRAFANPLQFGLGLEFRIPGGLPNDVAASPVIEAFFGPQDVLARVGDSCQHEGHRMRGRFFYASF